MSNLFYSSQLWVTSPVRAVYPHLSQPDTRFGDPGYYTIGVDLLANPELEAVITAQAAETLAAAQAKLGTTETPGNVIVKVGETKQGTPYRRVEFKMNATRGKAQTPQRPQVVDSKRHPINEAVFGGSLVRIAYELQYSVTGFGCNLSPKLKAVQVHRLVGPDGVDVEALFDTIEGFTTERSVPAGTDLTTNDEGSAPTTAGDF